MSGLESMNPVRPYYEANTFATELIDLGDYIRTAVAKVIEHRDRMARMQQFYAHMRTYVTCPTCD